MFIYSFFLTTIYVFLLFSFFIVSFSLSFSPPVRWGLLDFMSDTSPLPPLPLPSSPSSSSSAILCDQCSAPDLNGESARSVCRAGPQLRVCEISVPRRTSTASLRGQCSAPDLNGESARSVLRAGPQPRVCEISVACRTSTASLRDQCCVPDLNRESARSVLRAGPQLDPASSVLWQEKKRFGFVFKEKGLPRVLKKFAGSSSICLQYVGLWCAQAIQSRSLGRLCD